MSDDAEDRDLLGRVLEDRHDRDDRGAGRGGERQRVLEADPAFRLAGRHQRFGRGRAVRQDLEVDAGRVVPALRSRRRRCRCGSCSASSRARAGPCRAASRTPTAMRRHWPTGRSTADAAGEGAAAGSDGRRGRRRGRTTARSRRTQRRRRGRRLRRAVWVGMGLDIGSPSSNMRERRLRATRGRRQRVDGPASFAGTSRIRFRGSVAVATLSAHEALPGGDIRLCRDGTPSSVRPAAIRADRPMTSAAAERSSLELSDQSVRVHRRSSDEPSHPGSGSRVLALGLLAPAVLAADPTLDQSSRVLMAFNGDVTVARRRHGRRRHRDARHGDDPWRRRDRSS